MRTQPIKKTIRRGLTLIELITVIALSGVIALVVATLLVSGHKHWNALYSRVNRQETTDAFAVHRLFDAVCRKSSYRKATLGSDGASLELYYWNDNSTSDVPENYARFYVAGTELRVEHGVNKTGTWTPDAAKATQTTMAASGVSQAKFAVQGASVQMILRFTDAKLAPSICSAVRYNY